MIGGKWLRREIVNQNWVDVASPVVRAAAPPGSGSYTEPASPGTGGEQRSKKIEGYARAMDYNIASAAECNVGTPEFKEGCKSAVARKTGK